MTPTQLCPGAPISDTNGDCQPDLAGAYLDNADAFLEDDAPIDASDAPERPARQSWLTPSPSTFRNYSCCPSASTLVVRSPEDDRLILWPVTCKRWGCAFCANKKIRKLAHLVHNAKPNRWIRLGVNPALYETPEEAWRKTTKKVPELCRKLKKEFGECDYLRVCELHNGTTRYSELDDAGSAKGFPHYHALLRSSYIPQKTLSQLWGGLTGAPVVWIAKIDTSFNSFRYLMKYLTKLHRLEWTDRHVSYSRNFFRPQDMEKLVRAVSQVVERSPVHPWKYLTDRYLAQPIGLNSDGSYSLPDRSNMPHLDTPLSDFGIGLPSLPESSPRWSQLPMPGLAEPGNRYGTYDDF